MRPRTKLARACLLIAAIGLSGCDVGADDGAGPVPSDVGPTTMVTGTEAQEQLTGMVAALTPQMQADWTVELRSFAEGEFVGSELLSISDAAAWLSSMRDAPFSDMVELNSSRGVLVITDIRGTEVDRYTLIETTDGITAHRARGHLIESTNELSWELADTLVARRP